MAYTRSTGTGRSILAGIRTIPASIGRALIAMAAANPRLRRVEDLQALSDAQLAARGMRRENIVRVVFADVIAL